MSARSTDDFQVRRPPELDVRRFSPSRPEWSRRHFLRLALVLAPTIAFGAGCARYDLLVEKDQIAAERWGNLEAALQRRADLVPNLVAVVKGAAKHEEETLEKVTQARAELTKVKLSADDLADPEKMAAFQKAQSQLQGSLSRLMLIQEQYPDLKANQSFHDLQIELEGTENRILRAREEYNQAAREYNAELLKIRGQVVNRVTGKPFRPRVYFTASEGAEAAPAVSF